MPNNRGFSIWGMKVSVPIVVVVVVVVVLLLLLLLLLLLRCEQLCLSREVRERHSHASLASWAGGAPAAAP